MMVSVHVFWVLALGAGGGHEHGVAVGQSSALGPAQAAGPALSMLGLALAEVGVAALCAAALRPRASTRTP